jgi:hypothetical protein
MTLQLNNPKSPRVTTPAAAHQANSPPYRTLRNVASAAINHLARTMSPTARRAVAPPPCREARDELKPPAAFRVTVGRTQLRRPPPGAVGDLDPDDAVPGPDRDRDRLPRSTRAGVPDTVAEDFADQQDSRVSARMPRPQYLTHEQARGPRPLRPPGKRHALPNRRPSHHRTRPSPAASPPGNRPGSGRTQGNARSAPP